MALKWKECSDIVPVCRFKSFDELSDALLAPNTYLGPKDHGTVSLIVLRPMVGRRYIISSAYVSEKHGIHGSNWTYTDAKGHTDQVCVMSTAAIKAIATDDPETWAPAGDQLFLNFDMSEDNISPGDVVSLGEVVLEMTVKPHNGCVKFLHRYGKDALRIVNAPIGKKRRLRGIYFKVIRGGILHAGDLVMKMPRKQNNILVEEMGVSTNTK